MDPIEKLSALFAEFPGIGTRQSRRFVYFLLKRNRFFRKELASLIDSLEGSVFECARCCRFFMKTYQKETTLCSTCSDSGRDNSLLMIVEKDSDVEAIERSGNYHGTYFILGGVLPILEKDPESKIRISPLKTLIENEAMALKEVILACAVTPESEHTAEYVKNAIEEVAGKHLIAITTLGRGLSTGTELEYSDAETVRYALEGRK